MKWNLLWVLLILLPCLMVGSVSAQGTDLELEKTYAPGTYSVGDTVLWTVTLTNSGPEDATNITVTEDASGLAGLDPGTLEITPAAGTTFDATNLTWEIPGLVNGSSATLLINTSFTTAGSKENEVRITAADQDDGNSANNEANATVMIQEEVPVEGADLELEKTYTPGTYSVGDVVPWTVTLTNSGPEDATNITVTDDPSGLLGKNVTSITPEAGTTFLGTNWTIPYLENGQSVTLLFETTFSFAGEKTNAVSITSADNPDPDESNNSDEATLTIQEEIPVEGADLELEKTYAPGTYYVGDVVPWTVTLTNNGPGEANNITVRDDPSGLLGKKVISITPDAGTTFLGTNWTIPHLENGQSVTLLFDSTFSFAGEKTNAVSITSADNPDPDESNNSDEATVTILKLIAVDVEIKPETLNIKSKGVFTGFVTLPPCWSMMDIDWSSVQCNGAPAMKMMIANNRFIIKFDREALGDVEPGETVTFTITGKIRNNGNYIPFTGSDTIRVIDPGASPDEGAGYNGDVVYAGKSSTKIEVKSPSTSPAKPVVKIANQDEPDQENDQRTDTAKSQAKNENPHQQTPVEKTKSEKLSENEESILQIKGNKDNKQDRSSHSNKGVSQKNNNKNK